MSHSALWRPNLFVTGERDDGSVVEKSIAKVKAWQETLSTPPDSELRSSSYQGRVPLELCF